MVAGSMRVCGGVCDCWGACVVAGEGGHGCGGACMVAREGACMVVGCVCMVAGLQGCVCMVGGHVWLSGACIGYDEIWSMSGRYASYWNAFSFFTKFTLFECM